MTYQEVGLVHEHRIFNLAVGLIRLVGRVGIAFEEYIAGHDLSNFASDGIHQGKCIAQMVTVLVLDKVRQQILETRKAVWIRVTGFRRSIINLDFSLPDVCHVRLPAVDAPATSLRSIEHERGDILEPGLRPWLELHDSLFFVEKIDKTQRERGGLVGKDSEVTIAHVGIVSIDEV